MDLEARGVDAVVIVITSYSIHYTKLYEIIGLIGYGGIRIISAASDRMYQKMLIPITQLIDLTETYQRIRINLRDFMEAEIV